MKFNRLLSSLIFCSTSFSFSCNLYSFSKTWPYPIAKAVFFWWCVTSKWPWMTTTFTSLLFERSNTTNLRLFASWESIWHVAFSSYRLSDRWLLIAQSISNIWLISVGPNITLCIALAFLAKKERRLQILNILKFSLRTILGKFLAIIINLRYCTNSWTSQAVSTLATSDFFWCSLNQLVIIFVFLWNVRYSVFSILFIFLSSILTHSLWVCRSMNLIF